MAMVAGNGDHAAMAAQVAEWDQPPYDFRIPAISIEEYPLPMGIETQEIIYLPRSNMIIISQQAENTLLGVAPGKLTNPRAMVVAKLPVPWRGAQGPRGLLASSALPNAFWCSLQFTNKVMLIDEMRGRLLPCRCFEMPSWIRGPQALAEDGDKLWVACKDSGHLVAFNMQSPGEDPVAVYPTSPRPIFIAATAEHVYCSLDESSKIFCLDKSSGVTSEVSVEAMGRTPVGLVTDPDGHAWFVLLEGAAGTFGRLTGTGIQWLRLSSSFVGGLIHLAFDGEVSGSGILKLVLLGSSMAASSSPDVVAVVQVELHREGESDGTWKNATPRVIWEKIIFLHTQECGAHRLLLHGPGVFVTELKRSTLAYITGVRGHHTLFGGFLASATATGHIDAPAAAGEAAPAADADADADG